MESQVSENKRNPIDYLKILFRRKWLFVTPVFIAVVISIIACLVMPPVYESYTVILVQEEKILNPLIQGLAVSTNITQRMATIKEQLLGWNSLVELTKKLNLAKNVASQASFEQLIMDLRKNIKVQLFGPMLIRISYLGSKPQETLMIARTLSTILVDENMRTQTKQADVAINFIKEQLEVYKRKIKESELANLEEQLKKLLVDSTEQHPMVKDLRVKIAAVQKELDSGEYKVKDYDAPIADPTYVALKQEIDKMVNKEEQSTPVDGPLASDAAGEKDTNATLYKLMVMDKLDSVLGRDMRVNERIYNMLLQKLETAKITQRLEASKEGTRYIVIDPPRLPLKPVKPNKFKMLVLGLFLGVVAGMGLVFGREFTDQSFLDIDDAKENLEHPVLGAISRLTTQEEIDRENIKKKKLIHLALISSGTLIFITMLASFFKR